MPSQKLEKTPRCLQYPGNLVSGVELLSAWFLPWKRHHREKISIHKTHLELCSCSSFQSDDNTFASDLSRCLSCSNWRWQVFPNDNDSPKRSRAKTPTRSRTRSRHAGAIYRECVNSLAARFRRHTANTLNKHERSRMSSRRWAFFTPEFDSP